MPVVLDWRVNSLSEIDTLQWMNEDMKQKKDTEKELEQNAAKSQHTEETAPKNAPEVEQETQDELSKTKEELASVNDKYLRLVAEYDNFRKRTIKEKADLIQNGGERTLLDLLPVVDDIELALKNIREASDVSALREGVELICSKFSDYLSRHGVEEIKAIGQPFDDEKEQAIAMVPAPSEEQKGVVIDCTKKGYTLNGKVLRFADVVVGE